MPNGAELPHGLGLIKGVWLALANGYKAETGNAAIDQLVSRAAAWTACSRPSGW